LRCPCSRTAPRLRSAPSQRRPGPPKPPTAKPAHRRAPNRRGELNWLRPAVNMLLQGSRSPDEPFGRAEVSRAGSRAFMTLRAASSPRWRTRTLAVVFAPADRLQSA
jgi:hypothetical protein